MAIHRRIAATLVRLRSRGVVIADQPLALPASVSVTATPIG